jgi:zinc/manganese transport system permease protein
VNPSLSRNPVTDLQALFQFPFMVNALEAASIVAVLAAVCGWYVVLRRQVFAGHTLSVLAFPGATGAALIGLPISLGYYIACAAGALTIGASRPKTAHGYGGETAAIGTVQAVGLGLGYLFLSLNHAVLTGFETLLFGTFLGVSQHQVVVLGAIALAAVGLMALIWRPLLFATLDPDVARSRGVPVRILDIAFLLILGLAVAATSQITGVLLVFALLVAPAAAAQQITMRPLAGLGLSIVFALLVAWLGLGIAYFSIYPVGFFTTTFAFGLYVVVRLTRWLATRRR